MSFRRVSIVATRAAAAASGRNAIFQAPRFSNMGAKLQPVLRQSSPVATSIGVRFHSSESSKSKVWDFNAIKELSESPSEERILIDVREPTEYAAGYIPGALNIPVGSAPDALFMPSHEFEDKFGFEKPRADQELVFYCKAGVRSSAAAQLAQQVGYTKVGEYRGSWLDWSKNGGKSERD